MEFSGEIKKPNEFVEKTTLSDTDVVMVGGDTLNKMTVSNLKEALGINTLNRNLQTLSTALNGLSVATSTYTDLSIDGTVYTGTTEITYIRLQKPETNRAVFLGFVSSTTSSTAYTKYFSTNKLLIRKNIDGTWTSFTSI